MQQNLRTSSMEALQVQGSPGAVDVGATAQPPGGTRRGARWGAGRGIDGVGRPRGGGCMTKWMRLLALIAVLSLVAAACGDDGGDSAVTPAATEAPRRRMTPTSPTITEVGEGEGEVNIIAWAGYIEDGSTDEAYDWVTSFEEETGLRGQRDHRRHLGRDGRPDAGGRRPVRPGHRLRRREPATHRRRHGAAGEPRPDRELLDGRPEPAGRAVVHGRHRRRRHDRALRRALPVGLERADVLDRRVQGRGARQLVGRVRGADPARRRVEQGSSAGLRRRDLHRRRGALPAGDAARARHRGPVRAQRRSSSTRRWTCCGSSAS